MRMEAIKSTPVWHEELNDWIVEETEDTKDTKSPQWNMTSGLNRELKDRDTSREKYLLLFAGVLAILAGVILIAN